jgi:glycosyltransferase involved in cell wall biosynthesis
MAKVQIHLPTYNEEARIEQTLRAVLGQSFSDFTVVVHDNCSTDGTVEVCRRVAAGDSRVFINRGSVNIGAVLQGLRMRCGYDARYILLRSSNDWMHPDYLRETVGLLDSDPLVGLAYSHGMAFERNISDSVPVSDDLKIDTRGMDPFRSAVEVMSRYSAPFSLWGLYRREAFESCRAYQFMHGGDHAWVAEMALYGAVAPTVDRLDYRCQPAMNQGAGIVHNAKSQLEEEVRGIGELSFFYGVKQRLPFTDMAWGHVEMFSLARVDDVLKQSLILASREILKGRFLPFMLNEAAQFTAWIRQVLDSWTNGPALAQPNLYVWLLKVRRELDKIRFLGTQDAAELAELDRRVQELISDGPA